MLKRNEIIKDEEKKLTDEISAEIKKLSKMDRLKIHYMIQGYNLLSDKQDAL